MNDYIYQYLFPYEKIPAGSDIVIYGAGIVGMEYLKQMVVSKYCNVVAMLDKNAKDFSDLIVKVHEPENIKNLRYDYILLAFRSEMNTVEPRKILKENGVKEEKVICIGSRKEPSSLIKKLVTPDNQRDHAYNKRDLSIAVFMRGGIGDMIIIKKFVTELLANAKLDIYYTSQGDYLRYLYSDSPQLNNVIADNGIFYEQNKNKYSLSIEIFSTRYMKIDEVKKEKLKESLPDFCLKIEKMIDFYKEESIDLATPAYAVYQRRMYNGANVYTAQSMNGIWDIQDQRVHIPLTKEGEQKYRGYQLNRYITINYGNGMGVNDSDVSKMWPFEYFEAFVKMFKEKFPDTAVIQLGTNDAQKISGADKYILGETFDTVAHILNNAIFHLDIEGALVHMASQLGTKCFVLFGPTPIEYFGFKNNMNISAGFCQGCFGLYRNGYQCARHMKEPECMYSITPEIVMEHVNQYMMGEYKNE